MQQAPPAGHDLRSKSSLRIPGSNPRLVEWKFADKPPEPAPTMHLSACRTWAALIGTVLLMPAIASAALDPTDVIQIQGTASLIRDNNLFRLPDVDPTLFGIDPAKKADTTLVKGVGLKLDKLVSRQRLIADLNLSEQTYDKNTNLDFVGGDGRLAWMWQVGNYWSGEASYKKRRTLGGFSDFRQNLQDLIDIDTYTLTGGYQLHPRWRISAEITDQESTHSATTRKSLDSKANVIGTEVRYRTPAQNSIGMQIRRTDRSFPNRATVGPISFDNGHTENRLNAVASWQSTGALKIDAQLGRVEIQHNQLSQRDFSGMTWRAGAIFDATSKLRLNLNTTRDVRLYEDLATSFIVVNSVGFSPIYAVSPKVILQGDLTFEKRDYRGDPGFVIVNINREDNIRLGRFGVTYSPIRNIDLSLSYETGDRKSNTFLNSYEYQSWFGTLRIGF